MMKKAVLLVIATLLAQLCFAWNVEVVVEAGDEIYTIRRGISESDDVCAKTWDEPICVMRSSRLALPMAWARDTTYKAALVDYFDFFVNNSIVHREVEPGGQHDPWNPTPSSGFVPFVTTTAPEGCHMTFISTLLLGLQGSHVLPPHSAYTAFQEPRGVRMETTKPWEGAHYVYYVAATDVHRKLRQLASMLPGKHEVPGYSPTALYRDHVPISYTVREEDATAHMFFAGAGPFLELEPSSPRSLLLTVHVLSSAEAAYEHASRRRLSLYWTSSGRLPSGQAMGDSHAISRPTENTVNFVSGRVFVEVMSHQSEPVLQEAVARSIQYRIERLAPELGSGTKPLLVRLNGTVTGTAIVLNYVPAAPLSYLGRVSTSGLRATLIFGKRAMQFEVNSLNATLDGRSARLELPAFLHDGELIVPIEQVAKLLGCSVSRTPRGIDIMTPGRG